VRLKPITPVATDPAAAGAAAPLAGTPEAEPTPDVSATIKLSPVVLTPVTLPSPVTPPVPVAPPSPSTTSSIPAPTATQVQASKSKTSRISLDSAIGVSTSIPIKPAETAAPKTIRLKRPSDLSAPMSPVAPITPPPPAKSGTAPIRQTSRIPDSVLPPDVGVDTSTVTQKKTLKIRRPGADAEASADTSLDGVQMTPITDFEPVPEESKAFTITAIAFASVAVILLVALSWCLASDAFGPASGLTGSLF